MCGFFLLQQYINNIVTMWGKLFCIWSFSYSSNFFNKKYSIIIIREKLSERLHHAAFAILFISRSSLSTGRTISNSKTPNLYRNRDLYNVKFTWKKKQKLLEPLTNMSHTHVLRVLHLLSTSCFFWKPALSVRVYATVEFSY